ncbi:MAG: helix-turn-helix domain-containing protein [Edaphobacter sp.]
MRFSGLEAAIVVIIELSNEVYLNRYTLSTNLFNISDLISQAEAARLRGTTRQAIARLISKGRIRVWTIGGKTLVSRTEIEAFTPKAAGRPSK